MFSRAYFSEARSQKTICNGKDNSKKEVAKETIKKLHNMVLGKDKNIDSEYVKDFYVDIAEGYEDLITEEGTDRSSFVAKIICECFPPETDFAKLRVLDLAAGTGVLGPHLCQLGFKYIDAIDFSMPMLDVLQKKEIYGKILCRKLGESTDAICEIEDGTYDIVVIAGGFAHGHLNIQVLRQAARALKKGGLFVNAMSELYCSIVPELRGLEALIWKMEEEKIWKYVLRLVQESKWPGLFHVCRRI